MEWQKWFMGIASALMVMLVMATAAAYLDLRDLRKEFEASSAHEFDYEELKSNVHLWKTQAWWRDAKLRDHFNETRPEGAEQVTWEGMPRE